MQLKSFQSKYNWRLTSWNAVGQHLKAWTIKVLWTKASYIDWFSFKAIPEVSLRFSNFSCEQESIFFLYPRSEICWSRIEPGGFCLQVTEFDQQLFFKGRHQNMHNTVIKSRCCLEDKLQF